MSSLILKPRTFGPTIGRRPAEVGVDAARDVASRATVAPEPVFELSRQQRLAETIRILFGTIAFFAFLIALPVVALVPFSWWRSSWGSSGPSSAGSFEVRDDEGEPEPSSHIREEEQPWRSNVGTPSARPSASVTR
jgi:hypothetical protein